MVGVARQPYCRVGATLSKRFHIAVLPLDPIFKCHMLSALLACGLGVAAQSLPQTTTRAASVSFPAAPHVYSLRADALQRAKMRVQSGDSRLRPAYDRLVREADRALLVGPFSVMDKPRMP